MIITEYADLLTTIYCPRGFRCEQCGREDHWNPEQRINVVLPIINPIPARQDGQPVIGVLCLSLCPRCAVLPALLAHPARPAMTARAVSNLLHAHAVHLGITVGHMQKLIKEELHV